MKNLSHSCKKKCLVLMLFAAHTANAGMPLRSGTYAFRHRFAEHPTMPSIPVHVRIRGSRIQVFNRSGNDSMFPLGKIAEGRLYWHAPSGQWIIGTEPADQHAPEVGGCSDGPEVVDLVRRIYWTC